LAEEGYVSGLMAIAKKNGLDGEQFVELGFETGYNIGFITGKVKEDAFWAAMRKKSGIHGSNHELTEEILSRFILRPWMLEKVSALRKNGVIVGILSDQCHWLDELDVRHNFFRYFDYVFNSYHLGLSKRNPVIFDHVLKQIKVAPHNVLFIDDHMPHLERAGSQGIHTIQYMDRESFLKELKTYFP
jgi:HAD superfamily hydrolase (TIGR01509 family)